MSYPVATLISNVHWKMGWPSADAPKRLRTLQVLNEGEKFIGTQGSFLYLSRRRAIVLANNASTFPVPTATTTPPAMDTGKLAVIEDDIGKLTYRPPDQFSASGIATFYSLRNNRPAVWTLGLDDTAVPTIFFAPANTTGAPLNLVLRYQQAVAELVDTGASFSLLPDGYEVTLLQLYAEKELKGVLKREGAQVKDKELEDQLIGFYSGQRTSKLYSQTDLETKQRSDDEVDAEA